MKDVSLRHYMHRASIIGNADRICIVNYSVVASSFFRFAIHRLFMEDNSVLQRAMRVIRANNSLDLKAMFCILIQKLPIDFAVLGGNGNIIN
jgi:hypothetical protein